MTPEQAELEWIYDPANFFEAPYKYAGVDFDLLIDAGRAVARLRVSQEPFSRDVEEHVRAAIEGVFLVRQLQIHRKYSLTSHAIYQHSSGGKNIAIRAESAVAVMDTGRADLIVTDAAGKIVYDSRAERIIEHILLLDSLAPKLVRSATLRSLVESYSRAVTDPKNELVHLYEIRDALSAHYGSEQSARDALGISKSERQRLGVSANTGPFEQGRHRGKHSANRRAATESELNEARQLARRWIIAFAQAL